MKKISILIADDHAVVRTGLKALVECENDMTVVGEAENGEVAVRRTAELKPDVVIMDLMMPETDGAEATRQIARLPQHPRVLLLTSFGSHADLARALENGADGALLKDAPNDELIVALRTVAGGRQYFHGEIAKMIATKDLTPQLTERQLEILKACMQGFNTNDIARQFGISKNGVKKHFESIFERLGAATRTEAVSIALRHQLLKI